MRFDALQYCAWSREVFEQMRAGRLDAVHATIAYHEGVRDTLANLADWHRRFEDHADLIVHARGPEDVRRARATGRTAVVLGFQNPSPLEADLGMIRVWADLGVRFVQPTYNVQSLLGAGWQEPVDGGLTRMGREAVAGMQRHGIVVDLSHAGERTALEAIDAAERPVAVTHANPRAWRDTGRNVSDAVIERLARTGGMLGFSLYPHHLRDGPETTRAAFCGMVAAQVRRFGDMFGIGSDLCQGQPDAVVRWMREGRWTRERGEATFPPQPAWFRDNRDWDGIEAGLLEAGLTAEQVEGVMGANWMRFWERLA
ncbi:membrane dipeptidase [Jannaschia sp. Os4]|uniref:membrane dipeptidase n=1 Tax=Jannaschia sp. Os4 TaxID=2807617 RepID=UPI00193A3F8A|nr:membrane dipeptidase [Jannaschia sp. Os4]MBM2575460.1 membrane dipeptidase [Jannaschia sp. Os4]